MNSLPGTHIVRSRITCFGALGLFLLSFGCLSQTQVKQPWLPDAKLTPGAVDPKLTRDVICARGWSTKSVRHTSAALKNAVYREYGYDPRVGKHPVCEIDHLVSLELGGRDVKANLWPELETLVVGGRRMGFREKDQAENATHRAVCAGTIALTDAQRQIEIDWTVLYKRFVGQFPEVKK